MKNPQQALPKKSPLKNHTDAEIVSSKAPKASPFKVHSMGRTEYGDEDDLDMAEMEKEMEEDGMLDFEEIFQKSKKLHSRQGEAGKP